MTTWNQVRNGLKKLIVHYVFRKITLVRCAYVVLIAMIKELTSIYYGNDLEEVIEYLIELNENEVVEPILNLLMVFLREGYWSLFVIETVLFVVILVMIYLLRNVSKRVDYVDSAIKSYSRKCQFAFINSMIVDVLNKLTYTWTPEYETNEEKLNLLSMYHHLKARGNSYIRFYFQDESDIKEMFSNLIEHTDKLASCWKTELTPPVWTEGASIDLNTSRWISHKTQQAYAQSEFNIGQLASDQYEYSNLTNDPKRFTILGFKDENEYLEQLSPTSASILSEKDEKMEMLVKLLLSKDLPEKKKIEEMGYQTEFTSLYNSLSREGLAKFDYGKVKVSAVGKALLRKRLASYRLVLIKDFVQRMLMPIGNV